MGYSPMQDLIQSWGSPTCISTLAFRVQGLPELPQLDPGSLLLTAGTLSPHSSLPCLLPLLSKISYLNLRQDVRKRIKDKALDFIFLKQKQSGRSLSYKPPTLEGHSSGTSTLAEWQ